MNLLPGSSRARRLLVVSSLLLVSLLIGLTICETSLYALDVFSDGQWPDQFHAYRKARLDAHKFANEHGCYEPRSIIPIFADGAMAFGTADDLGYLGNNTPQPRQTDLLVFGDSFAYGYGVNGDQAFAARLGAYNAGVWGEAFPFHSRVFGKVVPAISPKRAIWTIYPPHVISCTPNGWYTWRTLDPKQHPVLAFLIRQFNRTRCSTLVLKTTGWGYNRTDYESLEWSLYDASDRRVDPGYARFEEAVLAVQQIANQRHIQVIPLLVPSKTQIALELNGTRPLLFPAASLDAGLATRRLARILAAHGLDRPRQIDLMDLIRTKPTGWRSLYFKNDAHFSAPGNAEVASFVARRLAQIPAGGN